MKDTPPPTGLLGFRMTWILKKKKHWWNYLGLNVYNHLQIALFLFVYIACVTDKEIDLYTFI